MDRFDMVERLHREAGVSYEEARAALEAADWDLLDALIALEKQGKTGGATAHYSTETREEPPVQEEPKREDGARFGETCRRFARWCGRGMQRGNRNALCMERGGEVLLTVPVTALVLLLVLAFWVVVPLMIVALFCGCRFYFTGPDLGREDINDAMGKATEAADSLKKEFRSGDGA